MLHAFGRNNWFIIPLENSFDFLNRFLIKKLVKYPWIVESYLNSQFECWQIKEHYVFQSTCVSPNCSVNLAHRLVKNPCLRITSFYLSCPTNVRIKVFICRILYSHLSQQTVHTHTSKITQLKMELIKVIR